MSIAWKTAAHAVEAGGVTGARLRVVMAFNAEGFTPATAAKWLVHVHGHRLHARHRTESIEQLPHDYVAARRLAVSPGEHQIAVSDGRVFMPTSTCGAA